MNRAGLWALVAILLLPTVGAVSGSGRFVVEGGVFLPEDTEVRFPPLAALNNDTRDLLDLQLVAPQATLKVFRERMVETTVAGMPLVKVSPLPPEEDPLRTLRDVEIRLHDAPHEGAVGIYPRTGAVSSLVSAQGMVVQARGYTRVANAETLGDENGTDGAPYYRRILRDPHVGMEGPGTLVYEGPGVLKLMGPDVVVSSSSGNATLWTGLQAASPHAGGQTAGVREVVKQWALLSFDEGRLRMEAASRWALAAPVADALWRGAALFTPREGALETPTGLYVSNQTPARLHGAFAGSFRPLGHERDVATLLRVEGDLHETTLRLQSAPLARRILSDPGYQHLALAGLAVVVGAGASFGAGLWVAHRRRAAPDASEPPLPFTVDDCMAAAAEAADGEDWPRAAEWLSRVRRLAPTSARTCADLAHAYCQMGQWEDGLRLYDEASELSDDGEPDFNAAVLCIEMGLPPEEVEARLARALARTPAYVVDVETDPIFSPLRGRPRFERMLRDAWARADDVDTSEGAALQP